MKTPEEILQKHVPNRFPKDNPYVAAMEEYASQSKPQEIPEENRQKLFNHMSTEHGLTLLESEMNSIYSICIGHEEYVKYLNWLHSKHQEIELDESNLVILDGANNDVYPVKTFQEFIDYAKEFNDDVDGIHPDIESVELYQRVGCVELTETGEFRPNKQGEQIPICKIEYVNNLQTRIKPVDTKITS